ncbi:MAG: hypothetical protein EU535_06365 [Promethearchaeota archaeon]|nr:MAG: hypothetical protein EU535_06365 [Candidatus Lokiarchaeota archaeon]
MKSIDEKMRDGDMSMCNREKITRMKPRNHYRSIFLIIFIIACSLFLTTGTCYEVDGSGEVTYVVDGDTLDVNSVGRIRLADIDTPEMDEAGGTEARLYLVALVYSLMVYVDIDDIYGTDPYGRIVAVLYVQHNSTHVINVNKALLVSGHAVIWNFENEFNPYSWKLYEPYPPESDPPPDPPPEDPPSDGIPSPTISPETVIGMTVAVGGVATVALAALLLQNKKGKRIADKKFFDRKIPKSKISDSRISDSRISDNKISDRIQLQPSSVTLIKDIAPHTKNVSVSGKVIAIQSPHNFSKSNGLHGRVGSFVIEDATGTIRVVLWDEYCHFLEDNAVTSGVSLVLEGFYAKHNTYKGTTALELHTSSHSNLVVKK